jgi:flagellar basal body-associated protein FliL
LREALSTEEGREMLEEALRDKLNDLDDEDDSPSRGGREG